MRRGLVVEVISYFFSNKHYKNEIERARARFWNKGLIDLGAISEKKASEQEALFAFWFLFDFKLKNKNTPLKTYYLTNYLSLNDNDRENYENLLESIYGLWKIEKVDFNKGIQLMNLISGKDFYVNEKSATHALVIGDVTATRISKIDDHYEIISPDNDLVFRNGLINPLVGKLLRHSKLNPKIVQDDVLIFEKENQEAKNQVSEILKDKVLDNGMCICDICHKKDRLGGIARNIRTGENVVICLECQIKMEAEKSNISVEEVRRKTKQILEQTDIFTEIKLKQLEGEIDLSNTDNLNKALIVINMAWNGLSVKERRGFGKLTKEQLVKRFKEIPVDFKNFKINF